MKIDTEEVINSVWESVLGARKFPRVCSGFKSYLNGLSRR